MFKDERDYNRFSWEDLGDIDLGRPNLGAHVPVMIYRLFQYTMRDVLIKQYNVETATQIFFDCGKLAGIEFCRHMLDVELPPNDFLAALQRVLKEQKISLLRIEQIDFDSLEMTLTMAEDLDCSGLPVSEETVCTFDEGFITGILYAYTGKEFDVTEIDCWASGDRVCRFQVLAK